MRKLWLILIVMGLISCNNVSRENDLVLTLLAMENKSYSEETVDKQKAKEFSSALAQYEKYLIKETSDQKKVSSLYQKMASKYLDIIEINQQISQMILADNNRPTKDDRGLYDKMAALKKIDFGLYKNSYENLKKAIQIESDNPSLFYLAGMSAGWTAKSILDPADFDTKERYLNLALDHYKRAIELKPYYVNALYGLAVLLVFEKNDPEQAKSYILRLLEKEKSNMDAFLLLARINYMLADYQAAIKIYKTVLASSKSEETKKQIEGLIKDVEDKLYESR